MGGYQARYWSVGRFTAAFASLPAAEHNLAQRLLAAQKPFCPPAFSAIREYLRLGNNRQAVTDYIRHNFGQTPLNQLSPEQLKTILTLLQEGKMVIPQPQQREATDRPLLPAEHNALKQLVTKLAAATGNPANRSGNRCWNFPG